MAFEKVDPKVDFPALEREILAYWERTNAFDTLRGINRGKPKWSFLDGPITANNPMGVHHAWGRAYKDIYQRYHAALGRELRYQNGFDCQGLWVEVEVEKEHQFESKRDIEKFGIDRFVNECKARVNKYAALQTEQSKRLGYWMDWSNSYYTMSDENNYAIWAFLKKCSEMGLLYKGIDVMPWCPRCGTGVSQMEMNEGYREVPHTSVFVRFPIRGKKGEFLLVWTTTPWTLSSNVAAAVGPDMVYVKVRCGDRCYYLGKSNFEARRSHPVEPTDKSIPSGLTSIQSLFKNEGAFEVIEEMPGSALVGWTYEGPFDGLDGAAEAVEAHRVIGWDQVTESEGTGIVHIAPGCGSEDYHLGKEVGLPQIAPLFEDGTFRPEFGFLAGKRFDEVADAVLNDLKSRNLLFAKEKYFHRYPHCWRCKEELVYRLVDEWFINMKWRDQIMESTRQARWIPEWGMERELDWLRNMGDWMISKKRYWGLALPIWECHQCGHVEVIGSREELRARAVIGWEEFEGHSPHRPWVDGVKIRCAQCGSDGVTRVKDVGNPWLDASIVSLSTMGYFSDREYWEQWFPADFVVEALPGQFRNWFYALLAVSTLMVGKAPFKVLKGHGLVMDDDGKPMHKSDGNAIWFDEAAEQFGVDVMRWLFASSAPERNVCFGPKHCDEVRRGFILTWWNVYSFFCNLARVDAFDPNEHCVRVDQRPLLDRWILSDLNKLVAVAHESYGNFDVARFCAAVEVFVEALSTWYVRRSRRRFYASEWTDDKRAAYSTLYEVLTTLNRALAPVIPFMSESIYRNMAYRSAGNGKESPASVHHLPFPEADRSLIDDELSMRVAASMKLISLGRAARKDAKLKVRQPLSELLVIPGEEIERRAVEQFEDHFREELNVKKVSLRDSAGQIIAVEVAPNMKTLGPKFGRSAAAVRDAAVRLDGREVEAALGRGLSVPVIVNDREVTLEAEDLALKKVFASGWAGAHDGRTVVVFNTEITPELRAEGLARDIIRNVQNLRKEAGLEIDDRIDLGLRTNSAVLKSTIERCSEYICTETLATSLSTGAVSEPLIQADVNIEGETVRIELCKAHSGR